MTHDEDEVGLGEGRGTNLLLEGVSTGVNFDVKFVGGENRFDLLGVLVQLGHNWNHTHLFRGEPEWPLAREVLDQDTQESLEAADLRKYQHLGILATLICTHNSTMNDHWFGFTGWKPVFFLSLVILHGFFGILILTFVGLICCEKGQKSAHILLMVGICGETHKTI